MDAGWINNVVLNICRNEHPMQPKAIVTRLIARGDSDHCAQRLGGGELRPPSESQETVCIACPTR